jgi:hypothetical protein
MACTRQRGVCASQASQLKREFDAKFHEDVEIKNENGCYSIHTRSEISPEMMKFIYNDFLLSRKNRTYPDLKFWKDKEASIAAKAAEQGV